MASPRKQTQPSLQRNYANVLVLILLTLALMPFYVMKYVQFEAHGFHPLTHLNADSGLDESTTLQNQKGLIQPASCDKMLNDPTIYDSNKGYDKDEMKRLTITDPPFYISLHNEHL